MHLINDPRLIKFLSARNSTVSVVFDNGYDILQYEYKDINNTSIRIPVRGIEYVDSNYSMIRVGSDSTTQQKNNRDGVTNLLLS